MKKMTQYFLASLIAGMCSYSFECKAASYDLLASAEKSHDHDHDFDDDDDDEYDILDIDETDDTDAYAIPFDDSELEDEEQINRAEKKEVFKIPQSK